MDGYRTDEVDETALGAYVNPSYANTAKRSRESHRRRLSSVIRSGRIEESLIGSMEKKSSSKKAPPRRKKRKVIPASKPKRQRRRAKRPVVKAATPDDLKTRAMKLLEPEREKRPVIAEKSVVSSYPSRSLRPRRKRKPIPAGGEGSTAPSRQRSGRRRRNRNPIPAITTGRGKRRRRRRVPIRDEYEEVGPRPKRRRVDDLKGSDKIVQYNESVRKIIGHFGETKRTSEVLVGETIALHKAEARKTPVLDESLSVRMTDAQENYTSEMLSSSEDFRGDPGAVARDAVRSLARSRVRTVMRAHGVRYGANHDPTLGSPAMLDPALVDDEVVPVVLSRGTAEDYVRLSTKTYFPEVESLMMRTATTNLVNCALNETVKSQKSGFRNEKYRDVPTLTVEHVNEGLKGYDITKRKDGRCIDPVCANAHQTSENDESFAVDPSLNNCVLYKFTGGRMTGRSWPRSGDFGDMQTFEKRRPCLGCLLYEYQRLHCEQTANSEESMTVHQQFTMYVGVQAVNRVMHSFRKEAMLPTTKRFRGSVGPMLAFDMANFVFIPNFERRSDGTGAIPALRVDSKAVYMPRAVPTPTDSFAAPQLDPPVRHTVTTELPSTAELLRDKMDILVDRRDPGEDEPHSREPELEGGRLHITSYSNAEIVFLKDLMQNELFLDLGRVRAMLRKYVEVFLPAGDSAERDFLSSPLKKFCVMHRRRWKYLAWNPFLGVGEDPGPTVVEFPRLALFMIRVNLFFFVCVFMQIQLERGNVYTKDAPTGKDSKLQRLCRSLRVTAENVIKPPDSQSAPEMWTLLEVGLKELEELLSDTEAAFDYGSLMEADDTLHWLGSARVSVGDLPRLAGLLQSRMDRGSAECPESLHWTQDEKSRNAVVHGSTDSESVTVDHLRSGQDYELYFLKKRLRRFLEGHVTAMTTMEAFVELAHTSGDHLSVLRSETPYLLLLPRSIRYDYSPFDVKRMKVTFTKHEKPKRWAQASAGIRGTQLDGEVFGKRYSDLLLMDLEDLGRYLQLCASQRGVQAFLCEAVPFCSCFFPVRRAHEFGLLHPGEAPSKRESMVLIDDCSVMDDDSFSYNGVPLFPVASHSVFWAWVLKVNLMQRLIVGLEELSAPLSARLCALTRDTMFSGVRRFLGGSAPGDDDDLNVTEDYATEEKVDDLCQKLEAECVVLSQEDDRRRDLIYHLYVLLHDHSAIGSEMVLRQTFSDESVFGAPSVQGEYTVSGIYDFLRPEMDSLTVCGETIQNIGPFIATHHLDMKARNQKENPVSYLMWKQFPTICQIRKIEYMIAAQWDSDPHARTYLTWIVWCTISGLYRHAHHGSLAANFPRILQLRAQFFSRAELGGKSLAERRSEVFHLVSENKYLIHDTLRENFYNAARYQPALVGYYEETWTGAPYLSWATFCAACVHNANFIREFYTEHGCLPTGPEALSPNMKKAARKRQSSAHVRSNLAKWKRRQNKDLYEAYRWLLSSVDNWSDPLNGMFLVVRAIVPMGEWLVQRRGPSKEVPSDVLATLRRLPRDDMDLLLSEFVYIFKEKPSAFRWMCYLLQEKHRYESSLSGSVADWVSRLGVRMAAHLLWQNFDGIVRKRKTSGQARRAKPLLYPGIYRLYETGYVRMLIEIMKRVVEERVFVSVVGGREVPVYLTMDPPEGVVRKIRSFPLLGKLTHDYIGHWERVFDFLRLECGLSVTSFSLLIDTVVQYYTKKSENKIAYKFRMMAVRDFQTVCFYYKEDFAKTKVLSVEGTGACLPSLHMVLEKNSSRWVNVASVTPEVFAGRFGFDCAEVGSFPRGARPYHEMTYTTCCGRLSRFPHHKGFGNYRAVNSMEVPERSWLDDLVDEGLCRCGMFLGNTVDCPVHKNVMGDVHGSEIRCCMFKKNDRKKKVARGRTLLSELRGLQAEIHRLRESGDEALASARKMHVEIYDQAKDGLYRTTGLPPPDDSRTVGDYTDCTIFGEFLRPGEVSRFLKGGAIVVQEAVEQVVSRAVRNAQRKAHDEEDDAGPSSAMDVDPEEEEEGDGEDDVEMQDSNGVDDDEEVDAGEGLGIDLSSFVQFSRADRDYGTYVPFDNPVPWEHEKEDEQEGEGEEEFPKRRRRRRRGKKTSESVYKISLENGLVDAVSRWAKRYCKYRDSYRCGDEDKTVIQRVRVMGRTLLVTSTKEEVLVYTWCSSCGSFVRQHERLFHGDRYLCESCWMKSPEVCFYFYDQVYEKTHVVTMRKAVDQLVAWVEDVNGRKEKLEDEAVFGDGDVVMEDADGDEEEEGEVVPTKVNPATGHTTKVTRPLPEENDGKTEADLKIEAVTISDMGVSLSDGDATTKSRKQERCSAYAISMCHAMEMYILLHEMDRYLVYDPNADPRTESVIKIVQTKRRKRRGYLQSNTRIRDLEVLNRVFRRLDRRRMMDKAMGKYQRRAMW